MKGEMYMYFGALKKIKVVLMITTLIRYAQKFR